MRIRRGHLGMHLVAQVRHDRLTDEHQGNNDAGKAEQAQGITPVERLTQIIAPVPATMGLQFG